MRRYFIKGPPHSILASGPPNAQIWLWWYHFNLNIPLRIAILSLLYHVITKEIHLMGGYRIWPSKYFFKMTMLRNFQKYLEEMFLRYNMYSDVNSSSMTLECVTHSKDVLHFFFQVKTKQYFLIHLWWGVLPCTRFLSMYVIVYPCLTYCYLLFIDCSEHNPIRNCSVFFNDIQN